MFLLFAFLAFLACTPRIDVLENEIGSLQEELDELRDEVDGLEDDSAALDDSTADDSAEPEPGTMRMELELLDVLHFRVHFELSEEAEGVLAASVLNYGATELVFEGRCGSLDVDASGSNITGILTVLDVTWDSGAASCGQLVGYYTQPVPDCDVLISRPVSCD